MQTIMNTASETFSATAPKRDVSISLGTANLYFLPAFAVALLLLLPFIALYSWSVVQEGFRTFFDGFLFLLVFILGIIIHEALHGITWMLAGKISPQNITYGIKWRMLTPYAHAQVPMNARAYRIG
ncbi:MAG: metalloprotease family protein, partial [Gloeotrichia echinulata HAB0833]